MYDFLSGITANYFHQKGYRPVIGEGSFIKIENIDFSKLLQNGNAFITDTEAYVISNNGRRDPVYFYKKGYYFFKNPGEIGEPKFHVLRCRTVLQYGENAFKASNTPTAIIWNKNRNEGERRYQLTLDLCGNCRRQLAQNKFGNTTEEFYQVLRKQYEKENEERSEIKTDQKGYTLDWSIISKKYKESKAHTCENPNCGLTINSKEHKKFMHTHHINGDKINNHPDNLQCLCLLCHSKEHEDQENNKFSSQKMQRQLKIFLDRYRDELARLGNPFV